MNYNETYFACDYYINTYTLSSIRSLCDINCMVTKRRRMCFAATPRICILSRIYLFSITVYISNIAVTLMVTKSGGVATTNNTLEPPSVHTHDTAIAIRNASMLIYLF